MSQPQSEQKRAPRHSFDEKCLDLAAHFAPPGTPHDALAEFAQRIQDCVEDFCNEQEWD